MKTKRSLAALQARAKSAATRQAQNRVVVTREVSTADDGTEVASRSAELWLYGTVGGYWWGFDSDDVAKELRALGDVDELLVRLHSFGGSAIEGIAIANLIANHPANVRIVVDGVAASAASMIALAGAELIMSPGSQLMVHDAWMVTAGNEAELHAEAEWIGKQSRNYAETYAHRAGGTADSWRETMRANNGDGTWYSAQEAVDAGLATTVENIASTTTPPPMPDPAELDDDLDLAAAAEWDLEVLLHPAARAAMSTWRRSGAPKPPTASAGGITQPEGAAVVDLNDKQIAALREQVGFPADADADTIVAAVTEALTESADPKETTKVPDGMKLVSATVFDDVTAKAERGAQAAEELLTLKTDAFLDKYKDRFPPTAEAREKWAADFRRDPAGTEAYLSKSSPLVPTAEAGHGDAPEGAATTTTLAQVREDPTYKSWEI